MLDTVIRFDTGVKLSMFEEFKKNRTKTLKGW